MSQIKRTRPDDRVRLISGVFFCSFLFADHDTPGFDGDCRIGLERLFVEQRAAVAEGIGDGFRLVGIVEDVVYLLAIIIEARTQDDREPVLTFGREDLLAVGCTCDKFL